MSHEKTESFSNEKSKVGVEGWGMLDRIRERIGQKKLNEKGVENTIKMVTEGIVRAKEVFEADKNRLLKDSPDKLARLTNIWYAWADNDLFKDAKDAGIKDKLGELIAPGGNTVAKRYARQLWRTEMVSYLAKQLEGSARTDKAEVMERIMGAQGVVAGKEDSPLQALTTASNLDPKIRSKSGRDSLALSMEKAGGGATTFAEIAEKFSGMPIKEVKVVTGGGLFSVPLQLVRKFEFKNIVLNIKDRRIYAQMSNGCRGNLVIMELEKKSDRAPKLSVEDDSEYERNAKGLLAIELRQGATRLELETEKDNFIDRVAAQKKRIDEIVALGSAANTPSRMSAERQKVKELQKEQNRLFGILGVNLYQRLNDLHKQGLGGDQINKYDSLRSENNRLLGVLDAQQKILDDLKKTTETQMSGAWKPQEIIAESVVPSAVKAGVFAESEGERGREVSRLLPLKNERPRFVPRNEQEEQMVETRKADLFFKHVLHDLDGRAIATGISQIDRPQDLENSLMRAIDRAEDVEKDVLRIRWEQMKRSSDEAKNNFDYIQRSKLPAGEYRKRYDSIKEDYSEVQRLLEEAKKKIEQL